MTSASSWAWAIPAFKPAFSPPNHEWRTRWAPSPTGPLHLGHLRHSLYVWGGAQQLGAKIVIRFEDHDRQRCKDGHLDAAWQDIEDFGFLACGHIVNPKRPYYRQSQNEERYRDAFEQLKAAGLVYACRASRKELAGLSRYPGTYRDQGLPISLEPGGPTAIRVKLPIGGIESYTDAAAGVISGNPHEIGGDFVIRDRNGNWSYQFSVVVDDNVDGINLIIRGMDLQDSTLWQLSLERLLTGGVRPKFYWHHPLLVGPAGEKLGKRIRSTPLRSWLEQGFSPELLIAAAIAGKDPEQAKGEGLAPISLADWLSSLRA